MIHIISDHGNQVLKASYQDGEGDAENEADSEAFDSCAPAEC